MHRSTSRVVTYVLIFCALVWLIHPAAAGERVLHDIESEKLLESEIGVDPSKRLTVFLPEGYDDNEQDYPVVYWFPGAGQSASSGIDFDLLDEEFQSGRAAESILVFLPSAEEWGSSLYLSSPAFGDWEGFFIDEVLPSIESTFRVDTSEGKRGIMGFSQGGLTAKMMAIRHPGTFSALGANDPGWSTVPSFVAEELPEGVPPPPMKEPEELLADWHFFFDTFPDSVAGYADVPHLWRLYGQLGAGLSPNPDTPLRADFPRELDATRENVVDNPTAFEAWQSFDLLNPDTVELHRETLEDLKTISVILPDDGVPDGNLPWNSALLRSLTEANFATQSIPFPGGHSDFRHERYSVLLSNVSYALQEESRASIDQDPYAQNFDSLGTNDASGVELPSGWTVGDGQLNVFRNSTNTAFNNGTVEPKGLEPHILNTGLTDDLDRGLAVHIPKDGAAATVQFVANLSEVDGNALQLKFDVEVWDWLGTVSESENGEAPQNEPMLSEVSLQVIAEIDYGNGFEQIADFGTVSTGELNTPTGDLLNGNDAANRLSFDSGVVDAMLDGANAIRLRWTTDLSGGANEQWVFGLDNVELDFLSVAVSTIAGDFDGDDLLTAADIDLLSVAVQGNSVDTAFDLNEDGAVDSADRDFWIEDLFGTLPGDADLNRSVDFRDFLTLAANFGLEGGWADGEFTGDGVIQFPDFVRLAQNFGLSAEATTQAIPEPTSGLLAGIAFFTALVFSPKRKRRPRRD